MNKIRPPFLKVIGVLLIITLAFGTWGCSALRARDAAASERPRIHNPNISDTDLAALVSGNTEFAFNLYQALRQDKTGNLFYSPHSISLALAMTFAGARGETEEQMAETLRFLLA
ncbi:MAG: serpin family protein, partial [Bacillota bacterium]|nr:serpin family protein [Bacillota bacterium]